MAEAEQKAKEVLESWLKEIAELKAGQLEIKQGKGKLLRSLADLR